MQAGARFNCRPFGVEAQRILRLEKGHIIIGQDTDGLTNPFEAACDWAVKMDKPFFIGQRSLQILQKKPINRALVGFNLAPDYSGPIPKECHLVIRDGTITGRVTSVVYSPTLGRVLGMAYVAKDQATIGNKFTIRVDGKKEIQAEVVKTPFYDPDSRRQTESIDKPKEAAA
jgi:sarcosine oxidase subunit alpha